MSEDKKSKAADAADPTAEAAILVYEVVAVPKGKETLPPKEQFLKVRGMRIYPGGHDRVPMTKEEADAIEAASPGCLALVGPPTEVERRNMRACLERQRAAAAAQGN